MYEIIIKRELEKITGLSEVKLSVPPEKLAADLSTNAAMASQMPADKIVSELEKLELIETIDVVGPGFINIKLKNSAFEKELTEILATDKKYGSSISDKKVIFEMVSSNPTGPLHIGHGRGAAIGDSLARIYEALGYQVSREYYVNDAGRQMNLLGQSVYNSIKGVPVPEDGYKGDYINEVASTLKDCSSAQECTKKAGKLILDDHLRVLSKFDVEYDTLFSEKTLITSSKVEQVITMLKEKGLTYVKDEALWFRSTEFGDDQDRVLIKDNGDLTYFASDCAYHIDKAERSDDLINFWGADHHGYVPRINALWQAAGYKDKKRLDVVLYQLVNLKRNGEKIAMSTRAGKFVTLEEVIDDVGKDAVRFFMLMRSSDAPLDFDVDLAKQESKNNPVYYVQYSHARICAIFRKAEKESSDLSDFNPEQIAKPEYLLIKKLAHYPYLLEKCGELKAPHMITEYLREVATAFHKYYDTVKVVGTPEESSRLLVLDATRKIISSGLAMLGVSSPTEM